MANLRSLPLCALAGALFFPIVSLAQQPAAAVRIAGPIDEGQLVTLKGNTIPAANAANDRGPVSAGLPMADLVLVLSRSPEQQAAFDAYVQGEYDTGSPNYHQWLTPEQIGERFGPAQADISTITGWLTSHGFAVTHIAKDRMSITFSGTAGQVQSAFHTVIHNLNVHGVPHIANMTDPQIPAALSSVVVGVKQLHDFHPHPLHKMGALVQRNAATGKWQRIVSTPATGSAQSNLAKSALSVGPHTEFGINGDQGTDNAYLEEDVTPYDFATIYNVLPVWNNGFTGSNQTISIIGTSDINVDGTTTASASNDVATYRSAFGLPAGLAVKEVKGANGIDPGICTSTSATAICGIGDLEENSLDVEVSGAVATGAQIVLVTDGYNSTATNDPIYQGAQYILENIDTSSSPVYKSHIISLSYGQCELFEGTSGNASYYSLWQSAAAEGVSVFAAAGDSGSPSCDDGGDADGNPYVAQYGLSVSGLASTPFNTAVGGTDFSWCQPYYNTSNGDFEGCATASTSQGSPAYWNTSNNATTGESAAGYVPEIPWNNTCENPIQAKYIETLLNVAGVDSYFNVNPTTPEETCSVLYNGWSSIDGFFDDEYGFNPDIETFVDTVGGSGGASGCVVNDSATDPNAPTCTTGSTSVTTANGTVSLTNDGWQKPSWQSGVTGIPSDGVRDIPDVSFFAGNGALDSATLICVSALGACTYSDTTENTAQEVGGTSVGTPEMAGVMALINQKAGAPQGLANPELYKLAGQQTYASCSAETVTTSSSCYFQDIDNGPSGYSNAQTISMPCNLSGTPEGGDDGEEFTGVASPNCAAINSGDTIGTLVSSGTTPGYNSATGFDLATGLGSMNVNNVVNAWVSDAGTATATVTATASPTTITINQAVSVAVTVSGSSGTPTGTIVLTGSGYTATQTLSGGSTTFSIPANSLTAGIALTANYSGDSTYASASGTVSLTVNIMTPTVTVSAPASSNAANPLNVTVTVAGPSGATAVPSGSVYLKYGSTTTAAATLSNGSATITIPANTLSAGNLLITADYSGDANYAGGTGTDTVAITTGTTLTPTIAVTPASSSIDSGQSLGVTVAVTGAGPTPTGTVTLSGGKYTSSATALSSGSASFTIPANNLSAPSATLTANYSGDSNYAMATSTPVTVTVTQSAYALAATTPAAVSPGASATSTITGTASSTDYSGTVTLNSCTVTNGPSNAVSLPTCSVTGTITYTSGTPNNTPGGTATVDTTAASAELVRPRNGWLGAGGGAVLAFLVFLGIPARRRSWRALLGIVLLFAAMGSLSACGGGSVSSSGGGGTSATTAGTYTFTVTGQGNDPASTSESTTFNLTVN